MAVGQVFWAVVVNNERPDVPAGCPEHYAQLMISCWDADPAARPTFAELRPILMNMLQRLRVATSSPLSHELKSKEATTSAEVREGASRTGVAHDAPPADHVSPDRQPEAAVDPDLKLE